MGLIEPTFAFTGRQFDKESGLYYHRARYYDPSVGRFLQQDPYQGKMSLPISVVNKYAYAGNSPTIYKDPNGQWFFVALAVGAVVGGFVGEHNGMSFFEGALTGAALVGAGYGVAAIIGAGSGAVFWVGTSAGTVSGLGGVFLGGIAPSTSAYMFAGALGAVASVGAYDPNASSALKGFTRGFLIAGAIGNIAQTVALDTTFFANFDYSQIPADAVIGGVSRQSMINATNYVRDLMAIKGIGSVGLSLVPLLH